MAYRFACAECGTKDDPRTEVRDTGTFRFCTKCATPEAFAAREAKVVEGLIERRHELLHELEWIDAYVAEHATAQENTILAQEEREAQKKAELDFLREKLRKGFLAARSGEDRRAIRLVWNAFGFSDGPDA